MSPSVLIIGYTTRHVAKSAECAGYEVYAVDHFCDQDLLWCTKDAIAFDELDNVPFIVEEMLSRHEIDCVVTTSGAELLDLPNRLGTDPEVAARFMDKGKTQEFFESLGVLVPQKLSDGEYPAMMKTLSGAGGWRNAVVCNDAERTRWEEFVDHEPFMMQEFIAGVSASVSCVGTGNSAKAIAANEQILRGGNAEAYAFSGSVTPCTHPMTERMMDIAEEIVAASGCVGSVGVDFVLTDNALYAIEINPRFQGTVDTVEASCGANLFQMHTDACYGILPSVMPKHRQFCVRKILLAPKHLVLNIDMRKFAGTIADIPHPETVFEKGDIMFSVFGWGKSREEAFISLDKHITNTIQYIDI
ncbi:MAG: ATP-grasp domain-containing protein [Methanocalculaceae archaeon]|jgi:predicted ATP-grasp superfamily ATP-dependent carboligase|nr:ATP-grasp domain-containing protein [Methanocalculaceae archaeon]